MIVRLIVFVAIFFIGWWLYRQFVILKGKKAPTKHKKSSSESPSAEQESMVQCRQCQTYIPRSHAIHDQEARAFCCAEHLKAFNQAE